MEYLRCISDFFAIGGLVMWAIALLGLLSYYLSFYTLFSLLGYYKICAKEKSFFEEYFIAFSQGDDVDVIKENFTKLRAKIFDRVDSRLKYALALCAVTPLLGLLGTISGLSVSLGGILDSTSAVSGGISKALYTTQAGLSVALPVFIIVLVARRFKQKILINISKYEILELRKASLKCL